MRVHRPLTTRRRDEEVNVSNRPADEIRCLSEIEVRNLLKNLCTNLGFCSADSDERLRADPPQTVDEFTNAVFAAEGLIPDYADRRIYRQVREAVELTFGKSLLGKTK